MIGLVKVAGKGTISVRMKDEIKLLKDVLLVLGLTQFIESRLVNK